MLSDGASTFTPGVSVRTGATSRFQHADRLGSFYRQTNAGQGVASSRRWDAFGNLESTSGAAAGPFGFAGGWGYQSDAESGLQLLGHRYYDPSTGRFLTRDPIKDGRNWYPYAENSPGKWADPDGQVVFVVYGIYFAAGFVLGGGAAIALDQASRSSRPKVRRRPLPLPPKPATSDNRDERGRIEREMDRQGVPRKHYPDIKDRIHGEKRGGPRGPDKGQDLSWPLIIEIIKQYKKERGIR